jgi:hypothetical protein
MKGLAESEPPNKRPDQPWASRPHPTDRVRHGPNLVLKIEVGARFSSRGTVEICS